MAVADKLRALTEALKEQEKQLAELKKEQDSAEQHAASKHLASHHDALVATIGTLRSLIETLGEMGL